MIHKREDSNTEIDYESVQITKKSYMNRLPKKVNIKSFKTYTSSKTLNHFVLFWLFCISGSF